MKFLLLLLIMTSSTAAIKSMEQNKPIIHAELMINKNAARSAAYGSKELHTIINEAGISTHPFDILVPVKTKPAIPGMPPYLPIKDIDSCSTGTRLPFILNGQETLLTCTNNPVSKLPFKQHCQKYITKFNAEPSFAHSKSYSIEYPALREALMENNLIKRVRQTHMGNRSMSKQLIFTVPAHDNFKPYAIKTNNHKTVTNRQIRSKRHTLLKK